MTATSPLKSSVCHCSYPSSACDPWEKALLGLKQCSFPSPLAGEGRVRGKKAAKQRRSGPCPDKCCRTSRRRAFPPSPTNRLRTGFRNHPWLRRKRLGGRGVGGEGRAATDACLALRPTCRTGPRPSLRSGACHPEFTRTLAPSLFTPHQSLFTLPSVNLSFRPRTAQARVQKQAWKSGQPAR